MAMLQDVLRDQDLASLFGKVCDGVDVRGHGLESFTLL